MQIGLLRSAPHLPLVDRLVPFPEPVAGVVRASPTTEDAISPPRVARQLRPECDSAVPSATGSSAGVSPHTDTCGNNTLKQKRRKEDANELEQHMRIQRSQWIDCCLDAARPIQSVLIGRSHRRFVPGGWTEVHRYRAEQLRESTPRTRPVTTPTAGLRDASGSAQCRPLGRSELRRASSRLRLHQPASCRDRNHRRVLPFTTRWLSLSLSRTGPATRPQISGHSPTPGKTNQECCMLDVTSGDRLAAA